MVDTNPRARAAAAGGRFDRLGDGDRQDGMPSCDYARAYADGYKATVRTLQRRGLDLSDAEEIAQAAWVKAWERLEQLRDPRQIMGWVRTIAINLWLDTQQRQGRLCTLDVDVPAPAQDNLASIDLDRIIEMSSPSQREVLGKLLAGYSTTEVAQLLGISLDAVQHRTSRARAAIRWPRERSGCFFGFGPSSQQEIERSKK